MTTAPAPHTVTLYLASLKRGDDTRWYVCTEKPFRHDDEVLDAPWLIAGSYSDAMGYACDAVHAYRNHPRIRYALEVRT